MVDFHLQIRSGKDLEARLLTKAAEVDQLIEKAILDVSLFMEAEAKAKAGYKTGNLRRNIGVIPPHHTAEGLIVGGVGVSRQAYYGIWHHEGTGIFGHRHRPIVPVTGNMLAFKVGGKLVFARTVKGQRPHPFMRDAFETTRLTMFPARMRRLAEEIGNL